MNPKTEPRLVLSHFLKINIHSSSLSAGEVSEQMDEDGRELETLLCIKPRDGQAVCVEVAAVL
jgi:hypothetical protein